MPGEDESESFHSAENAFLSNYGKEGGIESIDEFSEKYIRKEETQHAIHALSLDCAEFRRYKERKAKNINWFILFN